MSMEDDRYLRFALEMKRLSHRLEQERSNLEELASQCLRAQRHFCDVRAVLAQNKKVDDLLITENHLREQLEEMDGNEILKIDRHFEAVSTFAAQHPDIFDRPDTTLEDLVSLYQQFEAQSGKTEEADIR